MRCQFEEREYEHQLNRELAWKSSIYNPGLVFENKIGIDAAIFSKNPKFWNLWNNGTKMAWKSGTSLKPEFWELVEETWKSDMFPKFTFNLFVQHKTPSYIRSPFGKEYYHWNKPYFRYDLTDHQQNTLYRLEQRVSSTAIVVYACPAFWKRSDLWRFFNGKLIENSNFVQPRNLHEHQRYTFVKGGKDGYAFSKPAKIEGADILKEIDRMFEKSIEFENNVHFVNILAREIKMVITELDVRTKEDFFTIQRAFEYPRHELGSSVMTVLIFNLFTNTTWGIGYKIKETNPRVQALIKNL